MGNSSQGSEQKCRRNQFLLRRRTAKRIGIKSMQTSQSRLETMTNCRLLASRGWNGGRRPTCRCLPGRLPQGVGEFWNWVLDLALLRVRFLLVLDPSQLAKVAQSPTPLALRGGARLPSDLLLD